MNPEYCKDCEYFYIYLATLAPHGKQFTPTCTIKLSTDGIFIPLEEINSCEKKVIRKVNCY